MLRIPAFVLIFCLIISTMSFAGGGTTNPVSSANNAGALANQKLGSKSALKSTILTPAASGGGVPMYSLNGGTPFSASISAPSGKKILEIFIHPSSTGDLSPVYLYENTGSGNNYNYSYTIPFAVSGVCANGLISCTPGTWNNCRYYAWVSSNGKLSLQEHPSTDFGGCYCINNSCGYNLASTNLSTVLESIGGSAAATLMNSAGYRLTVSGVKINYTDIAYYGQMVKTSDTSQQSDYSSPDTAQYEWETGSSTPSSYYGGGTNGSYLFAAAGSIEDSEKSNPDSMYNLIATSGAAQKDSTEQKTCYIKHIVNVDKHQNDYYTGVDGDGSQFDTSVCASIDQCVTTNGTKNCLCRLAPTGGGFCGCGQSYNYHINGRWKFVASSPDDYSAIVKVNGVVKVAVNTSCDTTSSDSGGDSGAYEGVANGTVYAGVGNAGGCNGTPTSSFYAYIQQKAWDTVNKYIDDQCQEYENNEDCQLRDEWVDGVRTWSDYTSTGLMNIGNTCKTFYGWFPHNVCYAWWEKKRVYVCKIKNYDFTNAKKRVDTITQSTSNVDVMSTSNLGNVNYQDYRESNGAWGYHNGSINVPLAGNKDNCMQVCKVKMPVQDTQAYSGTNTSQYRSINSYAFDYRKCTANTNGQYACPYDASAGESVTTDCQCVDEFAEAAVILDTLEKTSKDIICSSGKKTIVQ